MVEWAKEKRLETLQEVGSDFCVDQFVNKVDEYYDNNGESGKSSHVWHLEDLPDFKKSFAFIYYLLCVIS